MKIDHTTPIDTIFQLYDEASAGLEAGSNDPADETMVESILTELRRRDAELAVFKAAPTPWDRLPYAEKQRREAAMHRVAGAAGHGASVTTDFPWQGRTSISGSWDIEDLRKLLAAMEGR
jgi:hypothetical protein